jgi:hypothetical protein
MTNETRMQLVGFEAIAFETMMTHSESEKLEREMVDRDERELCSMILISDPFNNTDLFQNGTFKEDALARTCVCDAWSSPEDCPACSAC